jgi:hypothetical protein
VSTDTVIHRFVRPAVRRIARTRVTPNHLTTLRVVTGLAAAAAFAAGGPWPAIGGAVFVLSMLLDRADGELARQTGRSSRFGHWYDIVGDCLCNMLALFGIGIGLWDTLGALGPLLGAVAGAGVGVMFWEIHGLRLAEARGYQLRPGVVVDPDDALVLVPVFVWTGAAAPMLVAAAVITPLASVWLALRAGRRTEERAGQRGS